MSEPEPPEPPDAGLLVLPPPLFGGRHAVPQPDLEPAVVAPAGPPPVDPDVADPDVPSRP